LIAQVIMPARILVVDDEELNIRLVARTLTHAGYEVVAARNGQDALRLTRELSLDLALLDVMLPDLDGFELCRRIRQETNGHRLPVILLTALDSKQERARGFECGADIYLPKPFEPEELLTSVSETLRLDAARPVPK
jgi:DNA-binding response OmpR family regulator